jgi:hypothetical protein
LALSLEFKHRHRRPLRDLDGIAGVVDGDENYWALRSLNRLRPDGVAGVDCDEYVHAAAPRVDEAGLQFDDFTDADGPVEVKVADGGYDAIAATPLCGNAMGGLVDPVEKCAAVDESGDADIRGLDADAVSCLVVANLWRPGRLLCRLHLLPPAALDAAMMRARSQRGEE